MVENMQENKTKARNNSLDIVKFIAALLVVGVHANFLNDISPTVAKVVNAALGRMAVPFFACVTGYFLTKHEKKDNRGWIKNIKSLLSYYVVFSVIYIIWGFLKHEFAGMSAGAFIYTIVKRFVMYGTYYHLWFFPCMILGVVILHFAIKWRCEKIFWIISILCYVFGACTYTWYGIGEHFIPGLDRLMQWFDFTYIHRFITAILPFTFLGNYISAVENKWMNEEKMISRRMAGACLTVAILFNCFEIWLADNLGLSEGTAGSFGVLFVILLLFIVLLQNPLTTDGASKAGKFCRDSSILIYGLHPLVLEAIARRIDVTLPETMLWAITIIVLCIVNIVWTKLWKMRS